MLKRFKSRSNELEHIDTGNYSSEEYDRCLIELQRVNRWMGDARVLRRTLFNRIAAEKLKCFSVLDVGAGSGELLRVTGRWSKQTARSFLGVGLELNERSAQAIVENSGDDVTAVRGDALRLPFADRQFDYTICSLFTHHFLDRQVVEILSEMNRVTRRRLFVMDLHRHPIAYFLYTTVGKLVLHTRLLREDGALSILRSFKTGELHELAVRAGLTDISVTRHFPFRLVLSAACEAPSHLAARRQSGKAA